MTITTLPGLEHKAPRTAVVHLDRLPPDESAYVRTAGGRARCNRTLLARRVALTAELEAVTCLSCRGTIAGDEARFESGLPAWLAGALANVEETSRPAAARARATAELRRRHAAEYAELLEAELTLATLGGLR